MPVKLPNVPNPRIGESFTYATRRGRPLLFQVTDPLRQPLYPYLLAMHVNPGELGETYSKSKNVVMTVGGFVEFNWPEELDSLSASGSTGAFIGPGTGLTSGSDGTSSDHFVSLAGGDPGRHATMAWERQEDLLDLFRGNGQIFDGRGVPVLRGRIMVIFDRGIYMGHFTTFNVKETDEKAFSFELDWEFKVEERVYLFAGANNRLAKPGTANRQSLTSDQEKAELDFVSQQGAFEQNGDDVPPSPAGPPVTDEMFQEQLQRRNQASLAAAEAAAKAPKKKGGG